MIRVHSIETFGTHDGPGIRLVVFLQGCPFKCVYCHNPDTQSFISDKAKSMSAQDIVELLEKQRPYFSDKGGLTLSGGEPTSQAGELIPVVIAAKARGFHVALDTNGAIFTPQVNQLYDLSDVVILDVKHINDSWHKRLVGAPNANVLRNAKYREESGKPMWLRYVLVPGWTDQKHYLEEWAKTFSSYKTVQRVEILPYHTLGVHKYEALGLAYELEGVPTPSAEQIEEAKVIFEKYLSNVVVG